jgi:hypothetical protein
MITDDTTITACEGCEQPAHASETDDTNNHPECVPEAPRTALEWGGPAPEGVTLAWGARAIYSLKSHDTKRGPSRFVMGERKPGRVLVKAHTECMIDLLHDRQSMIGTEPDKERERFGRWLNSKAIPAIKRACVRDYITSDCETVVTFSDPEAGYSIKASPRASYGYLYLTAWKV